MSVDKSQESSGDTYVIFVKFENVSLPRDDILAPMFLFNFRVLAHFFLVEIGWKSASSHVRMLNQHSIYKDDRSIIQGEQINAMTSASTYHSLFLSHRDGLDVRQRQLQHSFDRVALGSPIVPVPLSVEPEIAHCPKGDPSGQS